MDVATSLSLRARAPRRSLLVSPISGLPPAPLKLLLLAAFAPL
jgi:hypothetical protein